MNLTDNEMRRVIILPAPNGDPCPVGIIGSSLVPITDERLLGLVIAAPALYNAAASCLKMLEEVTITLDKQGMLKEASQYQQAADIIQYLLKVARNEK